MARDYRGKASYKPRKPRPSSKTRFWYIGKRNKNNELIGLLLAAVLIGGGAWSSLSSSSQALLIVLLIFVVIVLFVVVFGFVAFMAYRQRQKFSALSAAQVDNMDGFQFERYVGALLGSQGFTHVQVTQAIGDYGIDAVAVKDGQRWAIQSKRYSKPVTQEAVREAVAGAVYYKCQRSMVVATNTFTKHAKALAHSNGTVLIDRNKLAEWIVAFQQPVKHK